MRAAMVALCLAAAFGQRAFAASEVGGRGDHPLQPFRYPAMPSGITLPETSLSEAMKAEFVAMTNHVGKLTKTLATVNSEAPGLLQTIRDDAVFLYDRFQVWLKEHPKEGRKAVSSVRDAYWASWHQNNLVLEKAQKAKLRSQADGLIRIVARADLARADGGGDNVGRKAVNLIREVALDMEAKAEHARHAADGLGKEVLVKVQTKRDGQELKGYQVWYVQRGMLDDKSFHTRFEKLSTPTEDRGLAPGRYALWARKDKNVSEPSTVRIPSQPGARSDEIDVEAP
jgi:hypothetical protein